jgi:integrase
MTKILKLTKMTVDRLPPCASGQTYYWDSELAGFGLRVGARSKAYFAEWRVKGKTVRATIGKHGPFTPEQARKRALALLADMQSGVNPLERKRRERAKAVTLETAFDAFMLARKGLKPNTIRDYRYCMDHYFQKWHTLPLLAITKDKVAARHAQLGKASPARANLAMRFLRALFNFAIEQYEPHIVENPVRHLSATRAWYRVERRQRHIKLHELKPWFQAVLALKNDYQTTKREAVRDYLLLLLLTGLRREEAAALKWDQVDFKARTLTVKDTKNREDHTLPLSDYLVDLLRRRKVEATDDNPYVFPGEGRTHHIVEPRKQILRVCRDSGVDFRLHDLRRTFATIAESLDIPAYALKRLLNHKMSADVTAGYIIADVERLREPMQKITDYVLKAAGIRKLAAVVPLQTAQRA